MWLGVGSVLASALFGLIAGRLTDALYGHVRASLLVMTVASIAAFYWFYLLSEGVIANSTCKAGSCRAKRRVCKVMRASVYYKD